MGPGGTSWGQLRPDGSCLRAGWDPPGTHPEGLSRIGSRRWGSHGQLRPDGSCLGAGWGHVGPHGAT